MDPWLLCVLALNLCGCQSFRGISQCNRVLNYINEQLARATELHARPPSAESYRELSELFGKLESELVTRAEGDGELERASKAFAKQMRKVSRETKNYGQALERLEKASAAGDAEREAKAAEDLKQIRGRAERLLESVSHEGSRLRETCHPKG